MGKAHRKKPKIKLSQSDYAVFATVTTLAEASRMYQRHPNTITYAIDAGNIAAVRVGGIVLVSIPSLRAYWGNPINTTVFQ